MSYTIRQVELDEEVRDIINRMDRACFPVDELCDKSGCAWWLVYDESYTVVGFAGVKPSSQWDDAGYLCRAGVMPKHRGQGLQLRMIKVRQRYARRQGWNWLVTDTTNNIGSANNLIRAGFLLYEPSVPWGPDDALYWKCKL